MRSDHYTKGEGEALSPFLRIPNTKRYNFLQFEGFPKCHFWRTRKEPVVKNSGWETKRENPHDSQDFSLITKPLSESQYKGLLSFRLALKVEPKTFSI